MKVRIKKLREDAVIPKKAHPTDAGFDLVATRKWCDEYGNICYGTDLAFEIPRGFVGYIFPRSSLCKYDLRLTNAVGVIDSGYIGEVTFRFKPTGFLECQRYEVGERIGQLIIMPIPDIEFEEAEELSQTDRGTGGYGSSGR